MTPSVIVAGAGLLAAMLLMLGELLVSKAHERTLLRQGAVEPPDPPFRLMQWAYPLVFVAMAIDGVVEGGSSTRTLVAGAALWLAAKALKFWAIRSLGTFWTFRLIVVPGAPLVVTGPYRWLRHPNYVAVVGELVGFALLVGARVAGPLGLVCFGYLLRERIVAEEAALAAHFAILARKEASCRHGA